MRKWFNIVSGSAACLLVAASIASAGVIVQPTIADFSSEVDDRAAAESVDGSGLSDTTIVETGDPEPNPYPAHDTSSSNIWWTDVNDENNIDEVFITFDLGDVLPVKGMHVWNLNHGGAGGRSTESGVETLFVEFSTDGVTFTGAEFFTLTEAPNSPTYTGETHLFAAQTDARYVRFDVQTTFENDGSITKGDPNEQDVANRAGLSEVRFIIPEPASLALLGVGGLMLGLRRRRG